jgi:hypothetical protein
MATKSIKLLPLKRILLSVGLMLSCSACQHARTLSVEGRASLDGGKPVVGGLVAITELADRAMSMPEVVSVTEVKTDRDGRFIAQIQYRGGDLNVALDAVPCRWGVAFVKWGGIDLQAKDKVTAQLIASADRRDDCDGDVEEGAGQRKIR